MTHFLLFYQAIHHSSAPNSWNFRFSDSAIEPKNLKNSGLSSFLLQIFIFLRIEILPAFREIFDFKFFFIFFYFANFSFLGGGAWYHFLEKKRSFKKKLIIQKLFSPPCNANLKGNLFPHWIFQIFSNLVKC
jgi:hypothetical protein